MITMTHITRREFGGLLALEYRPEHCKARPAASIKSTTRCARESRKEKSRCRGMAATDSSILYSGAFGTRDSSGIPVTADSIFTIASMTKAITTVAALQLVEQGKVKLDEPVSKHLPQLGKLEVLDGFDPETGKPKLRPATTPVTLKHLLTHTSGICYDIWDADMFRYTSQTERRRAGRPAADVRTWHALAVRHGSRLGRAAGGSGERHEPGRVFSGQDSGAAWRCGTPATWSRRRNSTGW